MCVPYGNVLLPYFVSQGKAGSGLLLQSWPASTSLEVILKGKLPESAGQFGLSEPVLFNTYARVFHFCARLFLLHVEGALGAKKATSYLT